MESRYTTATLVKQFNRGSISSSVSNSFERLYNSITNYIPHHPQLIPFFLALFPAVVETAVNQSQAIPIDAARSVPMPRPLPESLLLYSPNRETMYRFIYEKILSQAANNLIEGSCGVHADGTFPTVNFETFKEWKKPDASLAHVIGQPVMRELEACIQAIIDMQHQNILDERLENIKIIGFILLGILALVTLIVAACCLSSCTEYNSRYNQRGPAIPAVDLEQPKEDARLVDTDNDLPRIPRYV